MQLTVSETLAQLSAVQASLAAAVSHMRQSKFSPTATHLLDVMAHYKREACTTPPGKTLNNSVIERLTINTPARQEPNVQAVL